MRERTKSNEQASFAAFFKNYLLISFDEIFYKLTILPNITRVT